MTYRALDDRPGICEGCGKEDYPAVNGPSAKQITWNAILRLWVCIDCQDSWSKWMGSEWPSELQRQARKPGFLVVREKEAAGNGGS